MGKKGGTRQRRKKNPRKRNRGSRRLTVSVCLCAFLVAAGWTAGDRLPIPRDIPSALDSLQSAVSGIESALTDLWSAAFSPKDALPKGKKPARAAASATIDDLPEYAGEPYVMLEENLPDFTAEDKTTESFESYSELDRLGRCGVCMANVGRDLMPTEERGSIGMVRPSGWQLAKYDIVEGKYLYNRCHLIGYQLTGENANEQNLITGTRYMNTVGMLPFENQVHDYVEETGNHVLYRVTPIFAENELVARGVEMEAWSVEDEGAGVCFHVFVYNVQPGISIDYANGDSALDEAKE